MADVLNQTDGKIERLIHAATRMLRVISMIMIVLMMLFVTMDVMGRHFFDKPFKGSSDFIELIMGIVVFFGMAYCTQLMGDARVDVLYSKLSARLRAVFDCVTYFAAFSVYLIITWRLFSRAWGYLRDPFTSPVTDSLHIPYWPFILLSAVGCAILCLELLILVRASLYRIVYGMKIHERKRKAKSSINNKSL